MGVYKIIFGYGLLLAIGMVIPLSGTAQAERWSKAACPVDNAGVKISVDVDLGQISYNHSLTKRELASRVRRSRGKTLSAYEQPLGLTVWNSEYALNYLPRITQINVREYCAQIDSVSLDLNIKELDVYVVREYPRGSCQYAAVLAHEHDHVGVARSVLTRYRGYFETQIWSLMDRLRPVIDSSPDRASMVVFRQLEREIKSLFKQMIGEMKRLNNAIDAPRSYQKLLSLCPQW